MIKHKVHQVLSDIKAAAKAAGRDPEDVVLVGVTKFAPLDAIQEAIDAGIMHIAENRVQEAEKKFPSLLANNPQVRSHIIGHLQTNKAKDAIKVCSMVQSVDSLKLAQEIEKQAAKLEKTADILVQFNTAREEQKFGADQTEGLTLIEEAGKLNNVKILGLMTIAPLTEDQNIIRDCFSQLRALKDHAVIKFKGHKNIAMQFLSMGMSGDYVTALEEGANMLRIGRAIFSVEPSLEKSNA